MSGRYFEDTVLTPQTTLYSIQLMRGVSKSLASTAENLKSYIIYKGVVM